MAGSITFLMLLMIIVASSMILLILLLKVVVRNPRNRLNQLIFIIVVSILIGGFFYFISYQELDSQGTFNVLYYTLAHYFWLLALGFLFVSISILYKPELMDKLNNQVLIFISYSVPLFMVYFIVDGITAHVSEEGLVLGFSWALELAILNTMILTFFMGLSAYMIVKIHQHLETKVLKKRIILVGITCHIFFVILIGTGIVNFVYDPEVKLIFRIVEIVLIVAALALYFAFGVPLTREITESNHRA